MSKRWIGWFGGGILVVVLAWFGWRLSIEVPERLRKAEGEIVAAAARYGLDVRHGGLKFHILHFYLSLDDLEVRDAGANRFLAHAGNTEVSLSPLRLLKGEIPVSRIRVRNFRIEAGEWNRGLYEKISSSGGGEGGRLPEFLFVDGSVLLGPLGPVRRMKAHVEELRVREGRFFGRRIHASISQAAGEISIPGEGIAAWPFPSLEAELVHKGSVLKVRKARAWGGASSVRLSGFLETEKRLLEGKTSGEADLAKWIAGGYPGASFVRHAVQRGKIEFSASAAGPWNNPEGQARILLRGGDFYGNAVPDAEAALSARGRVVRLDHARAKLLGGAVDASGSYDVESSRADVKAAFSRVPLAALPWANLGVPFRLAGTADLEMTVSGTPDRLRGDASLALPGGVERLPERGQGGFKVRLPLKASASAELSGGRTLRLESARLQAGEAVVLAEGEILPAGRTLRLRGTAQVPSGRAEGYGFRYPVSWKGMTGEWELSGPWDLLRTTASLEIQGLAAWSLPPVPLTVKVDGVPSDALHFAADVPTDSFDVTAVGTVTAPMDPGKARASVSVSAREIDLADSGKWISSVLASLGKDPGGIREYLDGSKGMAEADGRIGLAPGTVDFQGSARSAKMVVRGIPLTSVEVEGEYAETNAAARWTGQGEGKFGDGVVRVVAKGSPGKDAEASADIAGLRISQALALLRRNGFGNLEGVVDARVEARQGPKGWEFPRVTARSKELSVGAARIGDVHAEGNLGPAAGRFAIGSAAPRMSLSGEVTRGGGWPATVSLSAQALPTSFLLAAAGRQDIASEGTWSAEAGGVVRLEELAEGKMNVQEAFPALRGSVSAEGPAVGAVRFREFHASGSRQRDVLAGELVTGGPDTRLAWEISLREPFGFRLEGPFSVGEALDGVPQGR